MADRVAPDYIRSAQNRLEDAAARIRQTDGQPFDDAFLELANVGMLVWSAGIDLISALMLHSGEARLRNSTQRRRFLKDYLSSRYRLTSDPLDEIGWSWLAQLHNFQHNLDLTEWRFTTACRHSGRFFALLNIQLPASLQLPTVAYAWLAAVR